MLNIIRKHPLAKQHFKQVIWRILQWQIQKRLFPNKTKTVGFVDATQLILTNKDHAAIGNWYYGLSEFEMMSFVLHFLRPKDCFIDIGANIGSYSVLASGVCKARSVAIEPVPHTFQKLQANIKLNQLESLVDLHHLGLSDKAGELHFTTEKGQQNHMVESRQHQLAAAAVEVSTLDLILEGYTPALIKIDVEGYETAVLMGGEQTLRHPALKGIIIETMGLGSRYGFDETKIHHKLKSMGFRSFEYRPFTRDLPPSYNPTSQTLYIRDYEMVKERLSSSLTFEVFGRNI